MSSEKKILLLLIRHFLIVTVGLLNFGKCIPINDSPGIISSLGDGVQGSDYVAMLENYSETPSLREKRFVPVQTRNKQYQSCIAPGEKKGHCRHLNDCILDDFRKNFIHFLDYMCIIEHSSIGVCCPEDTSNDALKTNTLDINMNFPEFLPAIGDKPIRDNVQTSNHSSQDIDLSEFKRMAKGSRGCGVSTKSKTRVIGGQPADPKEWPWMAAFIRKYADQYCAGVLITDRHILSAAHCFQRLSPSEIYVRLGEYDFARREETRSLDFAVEEIRNHEDFNEVNYSNDIAIVKIHRPTVFNTYIWPICLPPVGDLFEHKSAIVAGWGSQYYAGPTSDVLMEVAVPVWSHSECAANLVQKVSETVLCAGAYEGGRDSCQGDSGGPLLYQLENGRWVNIGIVSWGVRCGEPGEPGVYTRVSSYLDWIFANAMF